MIGRSPMQYPCFGQARHKCTHQLAKDYKSLDAIKANVGETCFWRGKVHTYAGCGTWLVGVWKQ